MNTTVKLLIALFGLIGFSAVAGVAWLNVGFPKIPDVAPFELDTSPAAIARGRYLAEHVAACTDCHSDRDWTVYAAPTVEGPRGGGGYAFDGGFGRLVSPNITPGAVKDWSDIELYRAITSGVNKSGDPLFPIMPWPRYARASKADILAIMAYVRTLQPIDGNPRVQAINFPLSLIMRTFPIPASHQPRPDPSDTIAYGEYLTNLAACEDCHTPQERGVPIEGMRLAGGFALPVPGRGVSVSSNITPHEATGIGKWTRAQFIERFKAYAGPDAPRRKLKDGEVGSIMPWFTYSGMTEADLGAIYDYLRTVRPVEYQVSAETAWKG